MNIILNLLPFLSAFRNLYSALIKLEGKVEMQQKVYMQTVGLDLAATEMLTLPLACITELLTKDQKQSRLLQILNQNHLSQSCKSSRL